MKICMSPLVAGVLGGIVARGMPVRAELVLVEDGRSVAPIVIFEDAPLLTRQAADELAYYIEKTSGAKPEIIEGEPDPLPDHAIWVGVQPVLEKLFPDQDFEFQHPEEILIAANDRHLVIAGRDRWNPDHMTQPVRFGKDFDGFQFEYGTHNAVYTFLHDQLGVRWLWPGELGEDVRKQETIAFEPFVYRYHPQVRGRNGLFPWTYLHRVGPGSPTDRSDGYWSRAQRLQLSSFLYPPTCHGPWGKWWDRFHETHPEYFALQPDGTRSGYGRKMCFSNPALVTQWLADVEAELEQNPNRRVFNVSPTDGYYSGHCICENCRAWDHPEGEPRRLIWEGISQTYVALSDRDITFANRCARRLKERFPNRELYAYMLAYGHSCPPPVEAVPDDNVLIGDVANFLFRSDYVSDSSMIGTASRDYFAGWSKLTNLHFWRPNVGSPVGFAWGMPDIPLRRTMADMRFAAEHGWMGAHVDFVRMIWSTQGPLYYLMAHLTWNPYADGEAILTDYYRRAFGPAAGEMAAYWTYLEDIREACYGTENPGRADHDLLDFYNEERLDQADVLLDVARTALGPEDDRYRARIDFVGAGLQFTRLTTECGRLVRLVNNREDPDGTARGRVHANWEKLRALRDAHPGAVRWQMFFRGKGEGTPITPKHAPPLWVEAAPESGAVEAMTTAEWLVSRKTEVSDAWDLVFSDRFDRDELGERWEAVDGGRWEIADGLLRGSGMLVSARGFPGGFQRLEFEARTDQAPALFEGKALEAPVSDLSSFIQGRSPAEGNPRTSGYFFQFGGFNNTRNGIAKMGKGALVEKRKDTTFITPDKWHKIVVENDAGVLRLIVDEEVVLEQEERGEPLAGEGHDRFGFFFYTPVRVRQVNAYVKRMAERPNGG